MGFVKPITGRNITTSVGMELADLGIPRWDPQRQCNAVVFGDNFGRSWGDSWQSPSILCYDDDYQCLGVPTATGIASEGHRRQAIPYTHNQDGISTILPCDFIKVGGWWYMCCMVVGLKGLGDERNTVFWRSRNLVDWEKTVPYVDIPHFDAQGRPYGHVGDVMLTFDQIGDWIYTFGTAGLARNREVWMWRMPAKDFPTGWFEPYGFDGSSWAWGNPNENTPILNGRYGELCFRHVQGNCVLSFFDAENYRQTALTVVNPEDDWEEANRCDYAHGQDFPQLYGGYITPASRLNEPNGMEFLVSQWNTASNWPYHVCLFTDTLQAKGPLLVPTPPEPVPVPEPEPPPKDEPGEDDVTPTELYEQLLRELSASGSVTIPTPEGGTVTLREAVKEIHEKERGWYYLHGRPRHPGSDDDQLGHVLNTRAEGLFTQAMVYELAKKAGVDVARLYSDVQKGLK